MLPQLSCQEAQARNGNEVSSVTSVQMSKEQSSSQPNDQFFLATLGKNQARFIDDALIDENLAHTLQAINKLHGDIIRDCSLESECMRTLVLIGICKMVQELQNKRLEDFDDASSLAAYYTAVRHIFLFIVYKFIHSYGSNFMILILFFGETRLYI